MMEEVKYAARFGHHHNPLQDFLAEVNEISQIVIDYKNGKAPPVTSGGMAQMLVPRINRALDFRTSTDRGLFAKNKLRDIAADLFGPSTFGGFQYRVWEWMQACFGSEISRDALERNHRFLEEALELVQASGCTHHEAVILVDYVYGRPVGEFSQEVGGVMVTLAALCQSRNVAMDQAGETELRRVWTKIATIREKQASKPKNSALPQNAPQTITLKPDAIEALKQALRDGNKDDITSLGKLELLRTWMEAHLHAVCLGECEGCYAQLIAGDPGFHYEESSVCAECAPTFREVKLQAEHEPDTWSDEESLLRAKAHIEKHIAAGGSLDDKMTTPL